MNHHVLLRPDELSAASESTATESVKVSVIIPTKNRPRDLEKTISSIARQSQLPYEIVIIDQSSTTSFTKAAALHIVHIHSPQISGAAAARNLGMETATGNIWLFLDDDVELEHGFIEELVKAYLPNVTGVSGIITNYTKPSWPTRVWEATFIRGIFADKRQKIYWNADKLKEMAPIEVDRFTGALMSFRASALEHVRWNTRLTGGSFHPQDDLDFCWSLAPDRLLVINPKARLVHHRTPTARNAAHWISIHANVNFYMWMKHWRLTLLNNCCFAWLNLGYAVAATLSSIRTMTLDPWRALHTGAQRGIRLARATDETSAVKGCAP